MCNVCAELTLSPASSSDSSQQANAVSWTYEAARNPITAAKNPITATKNRITAAIILYRSFLPTSDP